MSLRLIAKDLYKLQQAVDHLEKQLADCPPHKRDELRQSLARAKAERDQLRQILDGRLDR
ncbi:hypothetical protein Dvar_44640 [Desulfosarcina variabilis str. Montpellier]|uniref:hypothetical protein n=1 Tax=Desulfosarcina variabilis TaxID=2300 RepID=UPI003AFA6B44